MTTLRITGHTRILAHIGLPTESFTAPMIYNPWFVDQGVDVVVVPMGCDPADFQTFFPAVARLKNFAGALITMPHKISVLDHLDVASPAVQICGACNAVRTDATGRLIGDNFDGSGFLRALQDSGQKTQGTSALVLGTGGVGAAIAARLADAGVAELGLADQSATRAEALAARLARSHPQTAISALTDPAGDWDILVNATPLGMYSKDPLPFPQAMLRPEQYVGDVVLGPRPTRLIQSAQAVGCRTQVGRDMLFAMIPSYLEFFGLPVTTPDQLRGLADL